MQRKFGYAASLLLGTALMLPLATTGCEHHYYTARDPYYHDRHRWDDRENGYYNQWVIEIHGDPHRDYRHLSKEDQRRYWDWRHHHDHDRDHDRDHDHDHDRH
ncbi:MAG TPA: hypothetical protein VL349_13860 [Terriglobales bacterium]|jgi:hypothetical protein|nr:hypothetical protein [Terriglobales bacterium]